MPLALGIETSCDDTCVSLVNEQGEVIFNESQNQNSLQESYGGVVPELASRNHEKHLLPLIENALKKTSLEKISLLAVTNRPGLLGSLLSGYMVARTLQKIWQKPLVPVNHIEAHIFSPFLDQKNPVEYPFLGLVVSGGHTHLFLVKGIGHSLLLGQTLDDAAGEALDKLAKLLGLGWPGGPEIEKQAQKSQKKTSYFSSIQTSGLDFSFSGIKSQAKRQLLLKTPEEITKQTPDIARDYQEKIFSHILEQLTKAQELYPVSQIVVGGGVIANMEFRDKLVTWAKKRNLKCLLPKPAYATDNAAMVAFTGIQYILKNKLVSKNPICSPRHLEEDFFTRLQPRCEVL